MGSCFVGIGLLVLQQLPNIWLALLLLCGTVAAIARVAIVLIYRGLAARESFSVDEAHKLERRFALGYLSFAIIFGLFCAYAMAIGPAIANASIIALVYGYGAGVASGLSLRPRISIPGVVVATVPTIIVLSLQTDTMHWTLGLMTMVFLIGGIRSILTRYHATARDITMRRSFSTQARSDHLTGLPNRLAMEERFEVFASEAGAISSVAVHCLDLDHFKPINDSYGHPAGDAVLKAVAGRLLGVVRGCDFVARVGGDEFVVVQTQVRDGDEASALATRIAFTIAAPFAIHGHQIAIASSIGYVLSASHGSNFGDLIACADQALCAVKRRGGGIQRYEYGTLLDSSRTPFRMRASQSLLQ